MFASSSKAKQRRADSSGYELVEQNPNEDDTAAYGQASGDLTKSPSSPGFAQRRRRRSSSPQASPLYPPPRGGGRNRSITMACSIVAIVAASLYLSLPYAFAKSDGGSGSDGSYFNENCPVPPKDVPQYFRTTPNLWPGPTATGAVAFLAQTRLMDPASKTFVPNEPLQTSMAIQGMASGNDNIFHMMANLSPYFPSPGFEVDEYPLPAGAEIVQLHMLSRHGSRYPGSVSDVATFGQKMDVRGGKAKFRGPLGFLHDWKYELGKEVMVPKGRQELFNSGVLHSYMYGRLYEPGSKIVVRTTTQDRMLKSAENFLAGFFGLEWRSNATVEVVIEDGDKHYNNSLAGYLNCPNAYTKSPGHEAPFEWIRTYLADAVKRFNNLTDDFTWAHLDVYAAQTLCPYETVAFGSSRFCDLFTYDEWRGFAYSVDLSFASTSGFRSPTGRATGLGYQQELLARLRNVSVVGSDDDDGVARVPSQINTTLDGNPTTFPLGQSLYLDFTHDSNMVSVLAALGLREFADDELPYDTHPEKHKFSVSHLTPFAARFDLEVIRSPEPVPADRREKEKQQEQKQQRRQQQHKDSGGGPTSYVHLVVNQRTVHLGRSIPECDPDRVDGWCELGAFLAAQDEMARKARFEFACFGEYEMEPYGRVKDGVPN